MPQTDLSGEDTASSPDRLVVGTALADATEIAAAKDVEKGLPPAWLRRAGLGSWAIVGIALVVVGIVYSMTRVTPVFLAVFVALVLTSVLNPMVNKLSSYMPRGLAVVLSILSAFLVLGGLLTFVVTSVAGQWTKLYQQVIHGVDKIVDFLNSLPFHLNLTPGEVSEYFEDLWARGQDYVTHNWQKLATTVMSNAGGIMVFFTIVALALFVTVFFLLQGAEMWRWFLNMLPTRSRANWNTAAQAGWWSFSGYARGTGIIALVDGLLAWVFLEILRVPLAPALAVLVMIGALIPMIGAPLAMALAMVVALATDGVWTAVIVGIGIAGIGQFEGHILQPLIMGKQVSLSPVVVGIGVIAGTLLAGLLGAIIAIPIIGVTWAVFNSLYHRDPPIKGPLPGKMPADEMEPKQPGFIGRLFGRKGKKSPDSEKKEFDEAEATAVPLSKTATDAL